MTPVIRLQPQMNTSILTVLLVTGSRLVAYPLGESCTMVQKVQVFTVFESDNGCYH